MEYVGEWHLNYKDKKEMYSIAEGLNNIADVDFYRDEFGVYQYIEVIKDGNQFKQIN